MSGDGSGTAGIERPRGVASSAGAVFGAKPAIHPPRAPLSHRSRITVSSQASVHLRRSCVSANVPVGCWSAVAREAASRMGARSQREQHAETQRSPRASHKAGRERRWRRLPGVRAAGLAVGQVSGDYCSRTLDHTQYGRLRSRMSPVGCTVSVTQRDEERITRRSRGFTAPYRTTALTVLPHRTVLR